MSETKQPVPETKPAKPETPKPPKKSIWAKLGESIGNAIGEWFANRG